MGGTTATPQPLLLQRHLQWTLISTKFEFEGETEEVKVSAEE